MEMALWIVVLIAVAAVTYGAGWMLGRRAMDRKLAEAFSGAGDELEAALSEHRRLRTERDRLKRASEEAQNLPRVGKLSHELPCSLD